MASASASFDAKYTEELALLKERTAKQEQLMEQFQAAWPQVQALQGRAATLESHLASLVKRVATLEAELAALRAQPARADVKPLFQSDDDVEYEVETDPDSVEQAQRSRYTMSMKTEDRLKIVDGRFDIDLVIQVLAKIDAYRLVHKGKLPARLEQLVLVDTAAVQLSQMAGALKAAIPQTPSDWFKLLSALVASQGQPLSKTLQAVPAYALELRADEDLHMMRVNTALQLLADAMKKAWVTASAVSREQTTSRIEFWMAYMKRLPAMLRLAVLKKLGVANAESIPDHLSFDDVKAVVEAEAKRKLDCGLRSERAVLVTKDASQAAAVGGGKPRDPLLRDAPSRDAPSRDAPSRDKAPAPPSGGARAGGGAGNGGGGGGGASKATAPSSLDKVFCNNCSATDHARKDCPVDCKYFGTPRGCFPSSGCNKKGHTNGSSKTN